MTRSRIIIARYPGVAIDGTIVHKGREILWCGRTRRVLTACPNRIAEWRDGSGPDAIDLANEDACARACGMDSLSAFGRD